jgi:acyl-CoA reductase-like NAD-dependent aldehyde dehydrogenase
MQPGADIGPMISPFAKQRACDLVQSGVDDGATLLLDGRDVVVPGYVIASLLLEARFGSRYGGGVWGLLIAAH